MKTIEQVASGTASRIQPQLEALKVGESMNVRGFVLVTRCKGENRFKVGNDDFCQKASEAAFDACLRDLQG